MGRVAREKCCASREPTVRTASILLVWETRCSSCRTSPIAWNQVLTTSQGAVANVIESALPFRVSEVSGGNAPADTERHTACGDRAAPMTQCGFAAQPQFAIRLQGPGTPPRLATQVTDTRRTAASRVANAAGRPRPCRRSGGASAGQPRATRGVIAVTSSAAPYGAELGPRRVARVDQVLDALPGAGRLPLAARALRTAARPWLRPPGFSLSRAAYAAPTRPAASPPRSRSCRRARPAPSRSSSSPAARCRSAAIPFPTGRGPRR